jgi:hypothetical protein
MLAFTDSPSTLTLGYAGLAELAPKSVVGLPSVADVRAWLAKRGGAPSARHGLAET